MSSSSLAHRLAINGAMPRLSVGLDRSVNIGFLAPLSGPVRSWGLPGLNGCRIWEDWVNKAGGIMIGGRRHPVRIHAFDCGYDPRMSSEGAKHLVQNHEVDLLLMLGGDTLSPVINYLMDRRVLTATLLPSDLSPDTPYLIAPSETHPVYNVTSVEWMKRQHKHLKKVALCGQRDAMGLPSVATFRAAFKAAEYHITKEILYDPHNMDVASVVQPMLDSSPDVLCWCTSYTPMVHAMTEYAHEQGFAGQIISCTLDEYDRLIERTSRDFMEGFIFQFPDFDDPMLKEKTFFFNQPNQFFTEYNRRFPGTWSAVSWEYVAILDIWHNAVEKAETSNSTSVLAAMKQLGQVVHAFGSAQWWGRDIFGIDNALIGDWPVVTIQEGRARIVEFGSIPNWLNRHSDLLREEMHSLGQLWEQRLYSQNTGAQLLERSADTTS